MKKKNHICKSFGLGAVVNNNIHYMTYEIILLGSTNKRRDLNIITSNSSARVFNEQKTLGGNGTENYKIMAIRQQSNKANLNILVCDNTEKTNDLFLLSTVI